MSPPQKGFSLPDSVKNYLHATSNIDPIEPFIINKEMTPAFGFCWFLFGKKPFWRFFANQIHEILSEAEIQSLGIECDMPPLPVVVRKATGIWRLGSRFSVYFGSMETPWVQLGWFRTVLIWLIGWWRDTQLGNKGWRDWKQGDLLLMDLLHDWTKVLRGSSKTNMMPSFVLREREGTRCKFDLSG